jgi:hypothetical protein
MAVAIESGQQDRAAGIACSEFGDLFLFSKRGEFSTESLFPRFDGSDVDCLCGGSDHEMSPSFKRD